ncbi:LysR family transcriptional regulator [Caminibacter mediatlanticus TB-2]|uniref:LysR family transcriptional regulator n=1 Tax=Caminibacter mediatlanticus TB-2 TaxID=391592 RepID=A0AAI9F370_9BACT|nr:LysR family transcriptional regulator [Caminibacter mediatlanticus]EDM24543.1 hypothetical protein CMTB2_03468 [Caminibacter mediatlanticus TB-2]QCT95188.1 LysR family transcriptional regulator [Caminibacter mediatlanticus TB-2]
MKIEELIEKYKENGKITCASCYKIATKLKITPKEVGDKCNEIGVRITDCDLGQFGKKDFVLDYEKEIVDELEKLADEKRRVRCKDARELAKKYNLKKVRSAIKDNKFDVIYCELGVFKEKKRPRAYIKTKIWIENQKGELLFGQGKTEILELIDKTGSISKAAEIMGINYKKALNHIKILQKNLEDELVIPKKGINGGTELTLKAKEYISIYKQLKKEIEEFANERFKELYLKKLKGKK